jgi:hypothetical protein
VGGGIIKKTPSIMFVEKISISTTIPQELIAMMKFWYFKKLRLSIMKNMVLSWPMAGTEENKEA